MELTSKTSTILFIPETGIYPYARGLAVLGDAVLKGGNRVYITKCTGQMVRCPMMAVSRFPVDANLNEKKQLCRICADRFDDIKKKYGFSVIHLSDFVDEKITGELDDLVDIPEENWKNIMYKGFPVGDAAEYDFSLVSKNCVYPNLSNEHRILYSQYIKNTALSVELSDRICTEHKPSLVMVFNPYAQCQGACYSAEVHNADWLKVTYATHYNTDASKFIIEKSISGHSNIKHLQNWNPENDVIINKLSVMECWKDVIFRSYNTGSHIFSNKKSGDPGEVFNALGLDYKRKTIVVYTSSYDEMYTFENMMKIWHEDVGLIHAFKNQIDWLLWLRDFVTKRDDIQIVVRIHPREGGRQFGFGSKHLEQLKSEFSENTKSFVIVWPDDPISSYDLMELASLCLVPWTTMGSEVSRVGIPVLTYTRNLYYPDDDFIQVADNVDEYERRLTSMIAMDYKWKYLVKAVRFYHWRTFVPALDLGESVPVDFTDSKIWPSAPESSISIINDILEGKQDLINYNIKKWKESLLPDAGAREAEAMKYGIRFFLDRIYYPPVSGETILFRINRKIWRKLTGKTLILKQKPFIDYDLKFSDDILQIEKFKNQTAGNKNMRVIVAYGMYATLVHKGKMIKRLSPMIIRLAKLHEVADND